MQFSIEQTMNAIFKEEWGRIVSAIATSVGNLQLAEDCLQDAVEKALKDWPENGLPNSPAAWLISVAKRGAIDKLRRDQNFNSKQAAIQYEIEMNALEEDFEEDAEAIPDKRLEMMFVCCHPALEEKSRVALTLRVIGGLKTEEIAAAFLDKSTTMGQRLTRAKKKIAATNITYELPDAEMINDRVDGVLSVIYLIFNEGYAASAGENLQRRHLTDEAIRLGRIMAQLMPHHTEIGGLLALMLLHDSRRRARLNRDGAFVPLEYQDRSIWDQIRIDEGTTLIQATMAKRQIGPYQLQAAISALHSEAATWADTDWAQIAALYQVLLRINPSPVVAINHAFAVSYADSPKAALTLMKEIHSDELQQYRPYLLTMSDLLCRSDEANKGRQWLEKAISLCENDVERAFLEEKLASI